MVTGLIHVQPYVGNLQAAVTSRWIEVEDYCLNLVMVEHCDFHDGVNAEERKIIRHSRLRRD
jgi:hypothetical protein